MALSRTHSIVIVGVLLTLFVALMEVPLPSGNTEAKPMDEKKNTVVFSRINENEGTLTLVGSRTPNREYYVKIADTEEERAQGLSGMPSLKKDEGMLFIFPKEEFHAFWMKDMNFALDLVWIDSSWNVASTTKNATPESFPFLFYPPRPVQYVLEIPAS